MMVAIGFGTFYLAARFLNVFPPEKGEEHGAAGTAGAERPTWEPAHEVAAGHDGVVVRSRIRP
jgi:hypothetical protein